MSKQGSSPAWVSQLFAAIDSKDASGFASFLTDDAIFRFGNAPPVQGREAIEASVRGFFDSIAGLSHKLENSWQHGDVAVCCGEVCYQRHDGADITIPFADIFHLSDEKIHDYRIYMDITPVYADSIDQGPTRQ